MTTVISSALGEAIERFRAARAAVLACTGPEDMPDELTDAESQAVEALALAPCASPEELLAKLELFEMSQDGSLPIALETYFSREARP